MCGEQGLRVLDADLDHKLQRKAQARDARVVQQRAPRGPAAAATPFRAGRRFLEHGAGPPLLQASVLRGQYGTYKKLGSLTCT